MNISLDAGGQPRSSGVAGRESSAAPLEELYGALVLLCRSETLESPQVFALPRLVLLAGVETILSRFQFSNHWDSGLNVFMHASNDRDRASTPRSKRPNRQCTGDQERDSRHPHRHADA